MHTILVTCVCINVSHTKRDISVASVLLEYIYIRPFHQTQLEYARHVKLLPWHVETTLQKQKKSSHITPSTSPDPPPRPMYFPIGH